MDTGLLLADLIAGAFIGTFETGLSRLSIREDSKYFQNKALPTSGRAL